MKKSYVCLFTLLALLAGFLGGGLAGGEVMAKAKKSRTLRAQAFELLDAKGAVRASIKLSPKGDLAIAMYDAKGKQSESLVVTPKMVEASKKTVRALQKLEKMFSGMIPQR